MAVDTGVIAIWSGTLATIPANWNLCDGSGVTPNLVARFLRGAPAATDPGTTGGSDTHGHSMTAAGSHSHSLSSQGHSHTVNSAGSHMHGSDNAQELLFDQNGMSIALGSHSHTTGSDTHSHSTDTQANHTHTINAANGRPPYYEVAFIQAGAGAACAAGLIIIWTGLLADIPAGWDLCDGSGGRPDLRSRFLRGVNTNATDPGTTGGATTHTHTEGSHSHNHGGASTSGDSSHSHSFSAYTWSHNHNSDAIYESGAVHKYQTDSGAGNHTHSNTNTTGSHTHSVGTGGLHSHSVNSASSLPAYYAVAYIYNTAAADFPIGGILIWTGTLAIIPASYNLCDGGDGRPELRSRFLYGTAAGVDPGGTGGSDTHTHTDNSTGTHSDHSIGSAGAHQHSATNSIGAHSHSTSSPIADYYSAPVDVYTNASYGAHSHTFNNENSHTHTDSSTGSHNHNPWSTDAGRPAYYEVAFIQYAGGVEARPTSAHMASKLISTGVI